MPVFQSTINDCQLPEMSVITQNINGNNESQYTIHECCYSKSKCHYTKFVSLYNKLTVCFVHAIKPVTYVPDIFSIAVVLAGMLAAVVTTTGKQLGQRLKANVSTPSHILGCEETARMNISTYGHQIHIHTSKHKIKTTGENFELKPGEFFEIRFAVYANNKLHHQ